MTYLSDESALPLTHLKGSYMGIATDPVCGTEVDSVLPAPGLGIRHGLYHRDDFQLGIADQQCIHTELSEVVKIKWAKKEHGGTRKMRHALFS